MNMPGFTAVDSLYKTKGHSQREATRIGPRGDNEVVVQSRPGEEAANVILDAVKVGRVVCDTYCHGNMGEPGQGCGMICYWWPY